MVVQLAAGYVRLQILAGISIYQYGGFCTGSSARTLGINGFDKHSVTTDAIKDPLGKRLSAS